MRVFIIPCVAALLLLSQGCHEDPTVPRRLSGIAASTELEIPEPELVPYTNIPSPPPPRLYRISGEALADGPEDILEQVLVEEFNLKKAWHPQLSLCTVVFLDELIIELEEPDEAIYRLGFTSDFSGTAGPCVSHWNEYRFVDEK